MMTDEDYALAIKLHRQLNENLNDSPSNKRQNVPIINQPASSIIDPEWEITDPNPDIHMLFGVFNVKYFWNTLGAVEVKWSPRMYTCAGICTYKGRAGCIVSLSLPLLKFRPRKDLIETLLHEMIHAYLFITKNNKDRSGHGPEFCKHMGRINREAGTNITIYHAFHDEVNHYRTHVWRCNGSCKANPPYFGYVRRATNRAPGPNDFWFADHKRSCGGTFDKVGEPEGFVAKPRKKLKTDNSESNIKISAPPSKNVSTDKHQNDLRKFFTSTPSKTPPASTSGKQVEKFNGNSKSGVPNASNLFNSGLSKPVHGVQSNNKQGGLVVKHGGVKNNIFGFGKLTQPEGSENSNAKEESKPLIAPFTGKGYVLGSGGNNDKRKSRLLGSTTQNISSKLNTPSTSSRSEQTANYFEDLTSLDDDDDETSLVHNISSSDEENGRGGSGINCPVCNVEIESGVSVNEHLDDCNILEKIFNSSRHDTLDDCDSKEEDGYPVFNPPSPEPIQPSDQTVDCPNCTSVFTISTINQHLDQCLSFD